MLICFYYYVILFYSDCTFTSIYNIISLRGAVWAHKTCLTPPLYLPVTTPENERPYICARGVNLASFYDFSNGLWICSDSVVF